MTDSGSLGTASGQVSHVVVDSAQVGQRIDNFLLRHLKGVPRSHIYRILRGGEVRVNGSRVKAHYRLEAGDRVRVPPVRLARDPFRSPRVPESVQAQVEASVLLEDRDLLVLNKPSGLAVHGGSGVPYGVIEVLRSTRPEGEMLELVHRLDRATSGCLLIARRRAVLLSLHEDLRAGQVDKRYQALAAGRWDENDRTVLAPLKRGRGGGGLGKVQVAEGGRFAHTEMVVLRRFTEASLLEVGLRTGRTHQIRVHAAHLGHPLAGDDKYGDFGFNRRLRKLGLERLFLHASELRFRLPGSRRRHHVRAPLDRELELVLDRLEVL